MSEYLHLLKKKKKAIICFSRYPTHHPNGDLLTQVCNSSTCLNVTSDSEHSEGASCGLPASGVGGRAGGLSGPLAIFRVSHEAAFPLASSGIWLVRWLLDQATYRAHTHTKAPLFCRRREKCKFWRLLLVSFTWKLLLSHWTTFPNEGPAGWHSLLLYFIF